VRRILLWLAVVFWASAASAHAFLDRAMPPVGATLAASPPILRLFFTERIEPLFSGVEVATAAGSPVKIGPAAVDPANPAALLVPLPRLPSGRYRVSWHVVSVDTHRTEGSYEFTIQP
jgi:methionine-rich copper-binding protein CopC